jgi:hypothetical protein
MEQTQLHVTDGLTNMATKRTDLQGEEKGETERDFDAGTGSVA